MAWFAKASLAMPLKSLRDSLARALIPSRKGEYIEFIGRRSLRDTEARRLRRPDSAGAAGVADLRASGGGGPLGAVRGPPRDRPSLVPPAGRAGARGGRSRWGAEGRRGRARDRTRCAGLRATARAARGGSARAGARLGCQPDRAPARARRGAAARAPLPLHALGRAAPRRPTRARRRCGGAARLGGDARSRLRPPRLSAARGVARAGRAPRDTALHRQPRL